MHSQCDYDTTESIHAIILQRDDLLEFALSSCRAVCFKNIESAERRNKVAYSSLITTVLVTVGIGTSPYAAPLTSRSDSCARDEIDEGAALRRTYLDVFLHRVGHSACLCPNILDVPSRPSAAVGAEAAVVRRNEGGAVLQQAASAI